MAETAVQDTAKELTIARVGVLNNFNNNSNFNANNRNIDNNNARLHLITQMENSELYCKLCSYKNLELAFKKARKGKTLKEYVIEFEKNLEENLLQLRNKLIFHMYRPTHTS